MMDIKIEEEWKTVHYASAKGLLKLETQSSDAISRKQLKDFLSKSDVADSGSEADNENDMNTDDKNTHNSKRCPHSLSFINTNARSLIPKIKSLADCFFEKKHIDVAVVTETWFQTGRLKDKFILDVNNNYSLGVLTRERDRAANNGRQYGGAAIVNRLRTTKLEHFPLTIQTLLKSWQPWEKGSKGERKSVCYSLLCAAKHPSC